MTSPWPDSGAGGWAGDPLPRGSWSQPPRGGPSWPGSANPPGWYKPPSWPYGATLPRPKRPGYRESRPVRWWTLLISIAASLLFYVLVALVSWSVTSFTVLLVIGMLVIGGMSALLLSRGDRGAAVGLAIMTGFALGTVISVLAWSVFFANAAGL